MIVLNFFKFPHRRHYKFFDLGGKIGEGITGFWPPTNSVLVFWPQTTVLSFIKFYSKLRP